MVVETASVAVFWPVTATVAVPLGQSCPKPSLTYKSYTYVPLPRLESVAVPEELLFQRTPFFLTSPPMPMLEVVLQVIVGLHGVTHEVGLALIVPVVSRQVLPR